MSRISQQHADRRKNLAFHFQVRSPSFPKINLRRISSRFFTHGQLVTKQTEKIHLERWIGDLAIYLNAQKNRLNSHL